jgi:hypothetical protein
MVYSPPQVPLSQPYCGLNHFLRADKICSLSNLFQPFGHANPHLLILHNYMGTDVIPDYVQESGFASVDNLKILGFNVPKNLSDMKRNFEPTLLKIKK